jgi:hypothetical protein
VALDAEVVGGVRMAAPVDRDVLDRVDELEAAVVGIIAFLVCIRISPLHAVVQDDEPVLAGNRDGG